MKFLKENGIRVVGYFASEWNTIPSWGFKEMVPQFVSSIMFKEIGLTLISGVNHSINFMDFSMVLAILYSSLILSLKFLGLRYWLFISNFEFEISQDIGLRYWPFLFSGWIFLSDLLTSVVLTTLLYSLLLLALPLAFALDYIQYLVWATLVHLLFNGLEAQLLGLFSL